jgi:hypothetical protein
MGPALMRVGVRQRAQPESISPAPMFKFEGNEIQIA